MKDNGDIEKSARTKLGSYKMEPPESAWNALDAELDKKRAIILTKKANGFKMLSIGLVLILISFVSFYYLTKPAKVQHAGEVSGGQLPAAENLLTGNNAKIPIEPFTGNSNKSSGSVSQKIISPGNNKVTPVYGSSHYDDKILPAATTVFKNKPTDNIPDDRNKNYNDGRVAAVNNVDSVAEENIPLNMSFSDTDVLLERSDSNHAVTVNAGAIEKSDTSSTSLLYNQDNVSKNRVSFALFYSPDYSWCKLKDNTSDNLDDVGMYKNRENSDFSYSTGISVNYDLNDSWSLVSGITYSTRAKTITVNTMYAHADADHEMHFMYPTSSGMIEMPIDDAHPAVHEGDSLSARADCRLLIKFINLPLMVRVQAAKKKFTWYANGGFSVNFIVQKKAKIKMDNSEMNIVNHVQGLNKTNYGFLLGAGVQYNIFNGMDLFTEPVFRGSFTSITHDTALNSYPYSLGLKTGILFRF